MAIIDFDTNPDLSIEDKLKSLRDSVQMAFNEVSGRSKSGASSVSDMSKTELKKLVEQEIKARDQVKYPVGAILMSTEFVNPEEYMGFGTWVEWGKGRVPVGVDSESTYFAEAEQEGGNMDAVAVKHSHTLNSHDHDISHNHDFTPPAITGTESGVTISGGGHEHNIKIIQDAASGDAKRHYTTASDYESGVTFGGGNHSHTLPAHGHSMSGGGVDGHQGKSGSGGGGNTGEYGEDAEGRNLQPYITCYMFKRVS